MSSSRNGSGSGTSEGLSHARTRRDRTSIPRSRSIYVLDMFPYPERRGAARRASGGLHGHGHPRPLQDACAASTCCTRWAGTRSACPPSNTPSRPASIRARRPRRTSRTSRAQFKRLGFSYDWEREVDTTDPGLFQMDAVDFPPALQLVVQSEKTNKAEPIATLEAPGLEAATEIDARPRSPTSAKRRSEVVPRARHRAGQRGSHRRQERSRRLPGRAPADAPMDAAHHRLCRSA